MQPSQLRLNNLLAVQGREYPSAPTPGFSSATALVTAPLTNWELPYPILARIPRSEGEGSVNMTIDPVALVLDLVALGIICAALLPAPPALLADGVALVMG